jgi:hypothetical protein
MENGPAALQEGKTGAMFDKHISAGSIDLRARRFYNMGQSAISTSGEEENHER